MLFKNTSKRIMSICASGRGFTVEKENPSILLLLETFNVIARNSRGGGGGMVTSKKRNDIIKKN